MTRNRNESDKVIPFLRRCNNLLTINFRVQISVQSTWGTSSRNLREEYNALISPINVRSEVECVEKLEIIVWRSRCLAFPDLGQSTKSNANIKMFYRRSKEECSFIFRNEAPPPSAISSRSFVRPLRRRFQFALDRVCLFSPVANQINRSICNLPRP